MKYFICRYAGNDGQKITFYNPVEYLNFVSLRSKPNVKLYMQTNLYYPIFTSEGVLAFVPPKALQTCTLLVKIPYT